MNAQESRFDRHFGLFGEEGQAKLKTASVCIVGCGGLGTHVVQQLAYLGIGALLLVEPGELKLSSLNRYIGAWASDPIPGTMKLDICERQVTLVNPNIKLSLIPEPLQSSNAFEAVKSADYVFGCLDNDGARFVLNELCLAYAKPLIDLASDVPEKGRYGGRVAIIKDGHGCLHCWNLLDQTEVRRHFSSKEQLENEAQIYGVSVEQLAPGTGPSVVSLNSIIASLGVTAFFEMLTGLREPVRLINYYGHEGQLRHSKNDRNPDCYYCASFGKGEKAGIERYINVVQGSSVV